MQRTMSFMACSSPEAFGRALRSLVRASSAFASCTRLVRSVGHSFVDGRVSPVPCRAIATLSRYSARAYIEWSVPLRLDAVAHQIGHRGKQVLQLGKPQLV